MRSILRLSKNEIFKTDEAKKPFQFRHDLFLCHGTDGTDGTAIGGSPPLFFHPFLKLSLFSCPGVKYRLSGVERMEQHFKYGYESFRPITNNSDDKYRSFLRLSTFRFTLQFVKNRVKNWGVLTKIVSFKKKRFLSYAKRIYVITEKSNV